MSNDLNQRFKSIRVSTKKNVAKEDQINLLLLWNKNTAHFVYIRSLSALLRTQLARGGRSYHFCFYCLRNCSTETRLAKHSLRCAANKRQYECFPEKGNENGADRCKFKNAELEVVAPYTIYADFETLCVPVEGPDQNPKVTITKSHVRSLDLT